MIIRQLEERDWAACSAIYEQGIKTGLATFATTAPTWAEFDAGHRKNCRLVICCDDGTVAGWAAIASVFTRSVYDGVVELSLYIGNDFKRRGFGSALLAAEIAECEKCGIWTIQSLIMANNEPSLALHKKCGFDFMCCHKRFGKDSTGTWRNVVLMEFRSKTIGF